MKTNIRKVNYTPLIDSLVDEFGVTTAAVFGRVWRYCQMERGYCHAEQGRIADELNLHRKTINLALQELVENGYLTATTNSKGRTVIYRDTGKAGMSNLPPADPKEDYELVTDTVTSPVTETVTKSYTKKEKKENTTTSSSADSFLNSFLKTASQEQVKAYELVKRFSSQEKALEIAQRENPYEAAIDFLEWRADNGGKAAEKVRNELYGEERKMKVYSKCFRWFEITADAVDKAYEYHCEVYREHFDNWFASYTTKCPEFIENFGMYDQDSVEKAMGEIAREFLLKNFPETSRISQGIYV